MREGHGSSKEVGFFKSSVNALKKSFAGDMLIAAGAIAPAEFRFIFANVAANAENRLEETVATQDALKLLAGAMGGGADDGASGIPTAFTYFGQFVDHDVTKLEGLELSPLEVDNIAVLSNLVGIGNARSPALDLDSVYGFPAPLFGDRMVLGKVSDADNGGGDSGIVDGFLGSKSRLNDLPRTGTDLSNPKSDRAALIGDPRNDENTIVGQMHVAFLKAHNSLVDENMSFETAKRRLTLIYQTIVLNEYMDAVCGSTIANDVRQNTPKHFLPAEGDLFMPVEFAAAAFRFGHSMVRTNYNFNSNFRAATLPELFTFTAFSGQLGGGVVVPPPGFESLPDNWIIDWNNLVGSAAQTANAIDTNLTTMLFSLRKDDGGVESHNITKHLAKRNLLRGYQLGLPTGQAVARAMGLEPLDETALSAALPELQKGVAGPFLTKSPLWFYVLAEAAAGGGKHLGPVGGRIVGECLWQFVNHAPISILNPDFKDEAEIVKDFTLERLIDLAARQDVVVTG